MSQGAPVGGVQGRDSHHLDAEPSNMSQSFLKSGPRQKGNITLLLGPETHHNLFCRQNLKRIEDSHQLNAGPVIGHNVPCEQRSGRSESHHLANGCRDVTMPPEGRAQAGELHHLGFGPSNISQWAMWAGYKQENHITWVWGPVLHHNAFCAQ